MKTVFQKTRGWCVTGTMAALLSACGTATEWLNEDPGAGTEAAPRQSARDIVGSLGTPEAERPVKPKPEPVAEKPAPVATTSAEPETPELVAKTTESEKPAAAKPSSTGVDVSQLDLRGHFPTAAKVGSRDGFVYSPYDGRIINVKGMASGSLVADPRYPLEQRKYFKVP